MHREQENDYKSNLSIIHKHMKNYFDGVSKTLVLTELGILLAEIVIAVLSIKGYLPYRVNVPKFANLGVKFYFLEKLYHQVIIWLSLGVYFILYKHCNFLQKAILLIVESYLLTIILAFGSWNVNFFGFLFVAPIIIATPFGKQISRWLLVISLLLSSIYTVGQVILTEDYYNYVIGIVTLTGIIAFYFLSLRIYKSMVMAMDDVKSYYKLSTELSDEVAHDYLTKALSVAALHEDMNKDNNFKTCAFMDLDNFKVINDTKGHDIGDKILQLFVSIVQKNGEKVYRYGGDEFVILSELELDELEKKLENMTKNFTIQSNTLYKCPVTISSGIKKLKVNAKEKLFEILKNCDELMYESKRSGKNKITVGA